MAPRWGIFPRLGPSTPPGPGTAGQTQARTGEAGGSAATVSTGNLRIREEEVSKGTLTWGPHLPPTSPEPPSDSRKLRHWDPSLGWVQSRILPSTYHPILLGQGTFPPLSTPYQLPPQLSFQETWVSLSLGKTTLPTGGGSSWQLTLLLPQETTSSSNAGKCCPQGGEVATTSPSWRAHSRPGTTEGHRMHTDSIAPHLPSRGLVPTVLLNVDVNSSSDNCLDPRSSYLAVAVVGAPLTLPVPKPV